MLQLELDNGSGYKPKMINARMGRINLDATLSKLKGLKETMPMVK